MTKSINVDGIEAATHIEWSEWVNYLEASNAKELSHAEIAQKAYDKMNDKQASRGWWSQSIAVAYEQHIGRREPGQRADGMYEVAISKTLSGTMDDALKLWTEFIKDKTEFSGVASAGPPTISKTEKWRHWRCSLADGSRISVSATNKTDGKVAFTVTQTHLQNSEVVEKWRSYWKELLDTL